MAEQIGGVVCLWKYQKPKKGAPNRLWVLVESFPIDDDGYRIGKVPEHAKGRNSKHEWEDWMANMVYRAPDAKDYDWKPSMGRAVTIWDVESGVRLLDLNPPEWCDWLNHDELVKKLKNMPGWASMLTYGHDLYLGTARAVEEFLYPRDVSTAETLDDRG